MINPIPPLTQAITDKQVTLSWSAYFTNLRTYLDAINGAVKSVTHNLLDGLQGGNDTERYHLTEQEHTNAANLPQFNGDSSQYINGNGTLTPINHNGMNGLQGGDGVRDYYHLSVDNFDKVDAYPQINGDVTQYLSGFGEFRIPIHNNLDGLQGGTVSDYQHLTSEQVAMIKPYDSLLFGYLSLGL